MIVIQPEAVGSEQDGTRSTDLLDQRLLDQLALRTGFAKPRRDDHKRLGSERERFGDRLRHAGCRHDDHGQIDRTGDSRDARVDRDPIELATAQADEMRSAEMLRLAKRA